jgi:hypothetical protein
MMMMMFVNHPVIKIDRMKCWLREKLDLVFSLKTPEILCFTTE